MDPLASITSTATSPPPTVQDDQIVASTLVIPSPAPPAVPAADESSSTTDPMLAPMSKKAMKRAAKLAQHEATKVERRLKERTVKREKKAAKRADAEAGINVDEFNQQREERLQKRVKEQRFDNIDKQPQGTFFNARIIIDLGFDELMGDLEIKSLPNQLSYLYNIHRHSHRPFRSLLMTHLDQRLEARLEHSFWRQANGKRWPGTEWWDGRELDGLWKADSGKTQELTEEEMMEALNEGPSEPEPPQPIASTSTPSTVTFTPVLPSSPSAPHPSDLVTHLPSRSAQENVVYLTADSPNEIDTLEEGMTYVIGGIVDHNRYKNLCLDKAATLGIKTARLPIGTYLSALPTRKVLTVNQVFEILSLWVELRDWEAVLKKVIPVRKLTQGTTRTKRKREEGSEGVEADGEEDGGEGGVGDVAQEAGKVVGETEEEEEARLNG